MSHFVFHDHECVSHNVLALLNSIMQSFQSIRESWHYYINIIYFFGSSKVKIRIDLWRRPLFQLKYICFVMKILLISWIINFLAHYYEENAQFFFLLGGFILKDMLNMWLYIANHIKKAKTFAYFSSAIIVAKYTSNKPSLFIYTPCIFLFFFTPYQHVP